MYDHPDSPLKRRSEAVRSLFDLIPNENTDHREAPIAAPPIAVKERAVMPIGPAFRTIDTGMVLSWLLRGRFIIVLLMILGAGSAVAYGLMAKPRYTVFADIMVPPVSPRIVPNDISAPNMQSDSQLLDIESKLLVVKSGNVLRRVVDTLNLTEVPEFNGTEDAFDLRALLGISGPKGDLTVGAIRTLGKRITVERQQRSYIATIGVWTRDPDLSVRVATELTRALNNELAQADSDIAGQASSAIGGTLFQLKQEATDAEVKVAAFRREHNLQTSAGELVSVQSMAQINTKLNDAKTHYLEAKSRYQQLTQVNPDALDASSSLQSPTLTQLRGQYATLRQRYDQLRQIYGPRYPELMSTTEQIAGLRQEITREISRLLQATQVEMDQAQHVADDLTKQVEAARGDVSLDNDAQVTLAGLERDLQAKTGLYESFLKRAGETDQESQLKVTDIRLVSPPIAPERKSWPPSGMLLLGAGAAAGLAVGIGLALCLGFWGLCRDHSNTMGLLRYA